MLVLQNNDIILLFDTIFNIFASVKSSQVIRQLSSEFCVEPIGFPHLQFIFQMNDHKLGLDLKPGFQDSWSERPSQTSQHRMVCLRSQCVVQFTGMNQDQVCLLEAGECHSRGPSEEIQASLVHHQPRPQGHIVELRRQRIRQSIFVPRVVRWWRLGVDHRQSKNRNHGTDS